MAEKNQKKRERESSTEIIDLENPKRNPSFGDFIDVTTDDDDEIFVIKSFRSIKKNPILGNEIGDCSSSKTKKKKVEEEGTFVCEICVETKMMNDAFEIQGCRHSYCSECIVRYVASKIQENVISIRCPEMNCHGVLEPESCQSILPPQVLDRWSKALCETSILETSQNFFYCPFNDCSALLLDDDHDEDGGGGKTLQLECPHCNRSICAECKVPWHAGIICAEFQKLNVDERGREDIMFMEAAKTNNWKRCPKCKIYIDKISGCSFVTCRCRHAFCHTCGSSSLKECEAEGHSCCYPSIQKFMIPSKQNRRQRLISNPSLGFRLEGGARVKPDALFKLTNSYAGVRRRRSD